MSPIPLGRAQKALLLGVCVLVAYWPTPFAHRLSESSLGQTPYPETSDPPPPPNATLLFDPRATILYDAYDPGLLKNLNSAPNSKSVLLNDNTALNTSSRAGRQLRIAVTMSGQLRDMEVGAPSVRRNVMQSLRAQGAHVQFFAATWQVGTPEVRALSASVPRDRVPRCTDGNKSSWLCVGLASARCQEPPCASHGITGPNPCLW